MDKIKEHYKTIILLCVGLLILGLLIWYFFFVDHSDEEWWMQNHIALQEDQELGASIYTVTKDDKISKEFYYLGRMIASGNAEEFCMANTTKTAVEIEWRLDTPVRDDIYQYIIGA